MLEAKVLRRIHVRNEKAIMALISWQNGAALGSARIA
jgi:hypothetical protein